MDARRRSATPSWFAYLNAVLGERHERLVAELSGAGQLGTHTSIGETLEGRPLDLLTFGDGPLQIWATARQHPGESMAATGVRISGSGLLDGVEFLDATFESRVVRRPAIARGVRRVATVRLVPNMNPDGAVAGYLRVNAAGAKFKPGVGVRRLRRLRRTHLGRSPEVFYTLAAMDQLGMDAMHIHGDEAIAANFFAGTEGIPKWGPHLASQLEALSDAFLRRSPDFQVGLGYDVEPPGEGNMAVGSNAVAGATTL